MSLNANALLSWAEAKAYLIAGDADQAKVEDVINRASSYAERYCERPLVVKTYPTLRLNGTRGPRLYIKHSPVISIGVVRFDEVMQTIWKAEADGDPRDFDVVLSSIDPWMSDGPDYLYRADGWWSCNRPDPVLIEDLRAGFDRVDDQNGLHPIPGDLKEAAYLIVQKLYRDQARQLTEVATVTTPDGSLQMLDSYLPRRAREILDLYSRGVPVA